MKCKKCGSQNIRKGRDKTGYKFKYCVNCGYDGCCPYDIPYNRN